jgi:hypothetical protein
MTEEEYFGLKEWFIRATAAYEVLRSKVYPNKTDKLIMPTFEIELKSSAPTKEEKIAQEKWLEKVKELNVQELDLSLAADIIWLYESENKINS